MSTEAAAQTMTYKEAYEKLNTLTERAHQLEGRDLDEVLPMLEEFRAAKAIVEARIAAILSDKLLVNAVKGEAPLAIPD